MALLPVILTEALFKPHKRHEIDVRIRSALVGPPVISPQDAKAELQISLVSAHAHPVPAMPLKKFRSAVDQENYALLISIFFSPECAVIRLG